MTSCTVACNDAPTTNAYLTSRRRKADMKINEVIASFDDEAGLNISWEHTGGGCYALVVNPLAVPSPLSDDPRYWERAHLLITGEDVYWEEDVHGITGEHPDTFTVGLYAPLRGESPEVNEVDEYRVVEGLEALRGAVAELLALIDEAGYYGTDR